MQPDGDDFAVEIVLSSNLLLKTQNSPLAIEF
jgi:hypothetical protein